MRCFTPLASPPSLDPIRILSREAMLAGYAVVCFSALLFFALLLEQYRKKYGPQTAASPPGAKPCAAAERGGPGPDALPLGSSMRATRPAGGRTWS